MTYTIIKASRFRTKFKATIHKSGKLGFTDVTAKELGFDSNPVSYVKFAIDDDDPSVLYLINVADADEDAFKVNKAGGYFYVNTKLMFDSLGVDYSKNTVMYDMVKVADDEKGVYRMTKREIIKGEKMKK